MRCLCLALAGILLPAVATPDGRGDFFQPNHRLNGVGVDRERISPLILEARTQEMVDTQTFTILRDPKALGGAERIQSPKLQRIFRLAGQQSGLSPSFVAAIAYLESWGVANAESPAGPKGIMQIAGGTAQSMGLKVVHRTRYKTHQERRAYKTKSGQTRYKTVTVRQPYTVTVRDDRLIPERAVPAAAKYLARLESRYGGQDWAVFAYHCGEGCIAEVQEAAKHSKNLGDNPSVAAVFFGATPSYNRDLYNLLRKHMDRDYSPTYYFRIRRAQELLAMYREDKRAFAKLADQYVNRANPAERAPNRLTVWLKPGDFEYQTCEDLRRNLGSKLVQALDDPDFFGFELRKTGPGALGEYDPANRDLYFQASAAALGTLTYIAFETRRLHQSMNRRGEKFVPLDVTALVTPREYEERYGRINGNGKVTDPVSHCSGRVFDISTDNLPPGELEALQFILSDIGYYGYLGFVEEHGPRTLHIGPSPSSREFFGTVFDDASKAGS